MKLNKQIIALSSTLMAVTGLAVFNLSLASAEKQPEYDKPVSFDLTFAYHIDMDMAEQDVFIERVKGSGKVYRVTKADRDMGVSLYRTSTPTEHNPFDSKEVGPFNKGESLNLTMGDWFAANGSGSYTCTDGKGMIDVTFKKLVPDATYTMWHFFMAMPPTQPFIGTHDLPMGARDGSQSVFHTNAKGSAQFKREFTPCLQLSGEHLASGLAVAWHSDGKTYGPLPGDFATNSHVQLFLGLPKRSGI